MLYNFRFHLEQDKILEHKNKLADERRKAYEEYLKESKAKKLEEKQLQKLDILNAEKNRQITEELKNRTEKRIREIMNKNNEDWAKQMVNSILM